VRFSRPQRSSQNFSSAKGAITDPKTIADAATHRFCSPRSQIAMNPAKQRQLPWDRAALPAKCGTQNHAARLPSIARIPALAPPA